MIKVAMATVACAMVTLAAQRSPAPTAGDLVELDVVVVGRDGQTVPLLRRDDFEVNDDGQRVDLKTFDEIKAPDPRPLTTRGRSSCCSTTSALR